MNLYDSEAENNPPRVVLNIHELFRMRGINRSPFRLQDFNPHAQLDSVTGIQFRLAKCLAPHPVVDTARKAEVEQRMGNGEHGVWKGTVFVPPNPGMRPQELFAQRYINSRGPRGTYERFCIRRRYLHLVEPRKTVAIFTSGVCLLARTNPPRYKGAFAFVVNFREYGTEAGVVMEPGPLFPSDELTKSVADLHAIIAALSSRAWLGEGWEKIVIVTNADFVPHTADGGVRVSASYGWGTVNGDPIIYRHLWEELSKQMGMLVEGGCEVSFWNVPPEDNMVAYYAAMLAAGTGQMRSSDDPT